MVNYYQISSNINKKKNEQFQIISENEDYIN